MDSRGRRATSRNAGRWTGACRGRWLLTLTLNWVTVVPSFVSWSSRSLFPRRYVCINASPASSSPPLWPSIRYQCSQAPTQSRTDAPFHPCQSPPNNRPVPCRDPDQQLPSAQDVLTHSSSPSPILPNRRQRDYSQRSWRLYCAPRQLRVLHQFP